MNKRGGSQQTSAGHPARRAARRWRALSAAVLGGMLFGLCPELAAQSAGGATRILIKGASDTRLALPYQRAPVDAGEVSRCASNSVTLLGKAWDSDAFVYAAGAQPRTYYAQFATGSLEGAFYKIIGHSTDTLVLETEGDDLTAHPLGAIRYGDVVKIVPYWTIAGVFGETEADLLLEPRLSPLFPKDDVLLFDQATVGLNKAPSTTLYFTSGSGWTSVAEPAANKADTILPPGTVMIARRRNPADVTLVNAGLFYKQRRVIYVPGGNGTKGNDHYAALSFPEPVTLNESQLAGSVVVASTSPVLRQDELLVWRNARSGFNIPPNTLLYYRQGLGWFQFGDNQPIGDTFTIEPGEAVVVRKKAANAGADWLQQPPL